MASHILCHFLFSIPAEPVQQSPFCHLFLDNGISLEDGNLGPRFSTKASYGQNQFLTDYRMPGY